MEAKWLFDVELEQIQVVVHPQSVIHSAVEYEDGAVIAQLGTPDMRLPIQYALYYPKRNTLSGKRLDLFELGSLTFEKPDIDNFKGLDLAYKAMRLGGNIPTAFNAANEKAVDLFLNRKIKYLQITDIIESVMDDDVIRRKQYVRQIRASFDEEDDETKEIDFDEKEPEVPPYITEYNLKLLEKAIFYELN